MSLHDVQAASAGRWKAAVVGAYERGDRNVTVARLFELTEFYGVSVGEVFEAPAVAEVAPAEVGARVVINVDRLELVPAVDRDPIERLIRAIQSSRDISGEPTLTIRQDDLRTLALLYRVDTSELIERLEIWGLM
jgi:transcriptional regulator with XRE-family HTH domain